MKRDMELIRTILMTVEAADENSFFSKPFRLADYPDETVIRHVQLLKEAKLVEAHLIESDQGVLGAHVFRLTWSGHDFLEAARDDKTWKKAWTLIRAKGAGVPFELLKTILIEFAKEQFGLRRPGTE